MLAESVGGTGRCRGLGPGLRLRTGLGDMTPEAKKTPDKQNKNQIEFVSWGLGTPAIGSGSLHSEFYTKNQPGRPFLRSFRDHVVFLPVELFLFAWGVFFLLRE